MNKVLLYLLLVFTVKTNAQADTSKWMRAFPITDYMPDASDSVKIVQVNLPAGSGAVIKDKQIGLLRGVYHDAHDDTTVIGFGRCNLVKGQYYYFTINHKKSGKLPKEGDLLYTFVDRTPVYRGRIIKLAANFIELQNVYEIALYDRYDVFGKWNENDEKSIIDSMVTDIRFTGKYFLDNNPGMNVKVKSGRYEGKMVLNMMIDCKKEDVDNFLDYVNARPRLYAGRQWKVSEIFATWLSEGAPLVLIREN